MEEKKVEDTSLKKLQRINTEQIEIWYKVYNIRREKIELFRDFLISLTDLINNTYMGEDLMVKESDQYNHFKWCWKKTLENFKKEKIFLEEQGPHFDWLWSFYLDSFYITKLEGIDVKVKRYFNTLFTFNHNKSRSEFDMLCELYKLLDQNFKK